MIIHATDAHGAYVPRFCYHDKLSIAANCRMCLVEVEKAPKPLPACRHAGIGGHEGLHQVAPAIAAQKATMEFLLINHRSTARSATRAANASCRTWRWASAVTLHAIPSASAW